MIEMKQTQWGPVAEKFLSLCQSDDWTLENMRVAVQLGNLNLYGVFYFGKQIASIILRNEYPTLVIVGAGGITVEGSTYKAVLPIVKEFAKQNGFSGLRAHALDKVRARALEMAGWMPKEFIFGIELGKAA